MIGAIRPVTFGGGDVELLASFASGQSAPAGSFSITVPSQTKYFIIRLWGAGGGGAGGAIVTNSDGDLDFNPASGAGGGQHVETKLVPADIQPGDLLNFTIGDGGFGGGLDGNGEDGDNTSIDSITRVINGVTTVIEEYGSLTAKGGNGSPVNSGAFPLIGLGGGRSVGHGWGTINNVPGNNGSSPDSYSTGDIGGAGGTAGQTDIIGPFAQLANFGVGGGSLFGFGGTRISAQDGAFPGGAGGGGHGSTVFPVDPSGGDGQRGYVEVEAYG